MKAKMYASDDQRWTDGKLTGAKGERSKRLRLCRGRLDPIDLRPRWKKPRNEEVFAPPLFSRRSRASLPASLSARGATG
ncbi:hypothetical protein NL676_011408 [Syzygium grande]|nr:hypothetical protein NL676_011408 [Syzygium grande]